MIYNLKIIALNTCRVNLKVNTLLIMYIRKHYVNVAALTKPFGFFRRAYIDVSPS